MNKAFYVPIQNAMNRENIFVQKKQMFFDCSRK